MLKEKWGDQKVIWEEKNLNGGCWPAVPRLSEV